ARMSNVAPNPSGTDDVNALLDAAHVPLAVSAAAAALAGAGLAVALMGVQNVTLIHWVEGYAVVPWLLVALGARALSVAAKLMHARRWTLWPAFVPAVLLPLGSLAFFALSSMSGLFSPLTILGVGGGVTAIVFVSLAIKPFGRVAATRRRLRDAG